MWLDLVDGEIKGSYCCFVESKEVYTCDTAANNNSRYD